MTSPTTVTVTAPAAERSERLCAGGVGDKRDTHTHTRVAQSYMTHSTPLLYLLSRRCPVVSSAASAPRGARVSPDRCVIAATSMTLAAGTPLRCGKCRNVRVCGRGGEGGKTCIDRRCPIDWSARV